MDGNVYLGVWTNWSNGTVMGATLTMTRRDGNFLIAFTGFLIPFVASRFWSILCLIFHTYYSTPDPRDAVHHQRQVLLRNSSSPETGLLSLFRLYWAWRRSTKETKQHLNMLPIIFMGICCIAAFTAAGGFSSQISTAPGDEVLLIGDNCVIPQTPNTLAELATTIEMASELINDAANYAEQCYSTESSGILDCDRFVVQSLPIAVWDNNTACPFQDDICRTNTSNLLIDTGYMDSNDHLGLNAPAKKRFEVRYILQCAPLVTEGYATNISIHGSNWTRYNYGNLTNGGNPINFTYQIPGLDTQYPSNVVLETGSNFLLSSMYAPVYQGITDTSTANFDPIPQLFRSDGDLVLINLVGNGVTFASDMDDEWYRATTASEHILYSGTENLTASAYTPTEPSSPMGCLEQWQFCNSAYSREAGCGPVSSLLDSIFGAADLFNVTYSDLYSNFTSNTTESSMRLMWPAMIQSFGLSTLNDVLDQLGAKALASQILLDSGLQYTLPLNQWQLDVTNWFNTVLATLQSLYVNVAIGSTNPVIREFGVLPTLQTEKNLCNSQPLLRWLQRRRNHRRDYALLEWSANDALQLHRMAQEEIGRGTWFGCTDAIPITKRGEILASLDIANVDHPILAQKIDQVGYGNKSMTFSSEKSLDNKDTTYSPEPESEFESVQLMDRL